MLPFNDVHVMCRGQTAHGIVLAQRILYSSHACIPSAAPTSMQRYLDPRKAARTAQVHVANTCTTAYIFPPLSLKQSA